MDLKTVLVRVSDKKRREWALFFSRRGTGKLLNEEAGVGRTTLWRILNGTAIMVETNVVERIDQFILDYKKQVEAIKEA